MEKKKDKLNMKRYNHFYIISNLSEEQSGKVCGKMGGVKGRPPYRG